MGFQWAHFKRHNYKHLLIQHALIFLDALDKLRVGLEF
jgi:hypothetical protein